MSPLSIGIVGGGFTGLTAARLLAKQPGFRVTILDTASHALFTPRLIDALAGVCAPKDLHLPHHTLAKRYGYTFLEGAVERIDTAQRTLTRRTATGEEETLTFDKLILSYGATTAFFGVDPSYAYTLKTWEDLVRLEEMLATLHAQPPSLASDVAKQHPSVVIIGGGATGIEAALAIDTRLCAQGIARENRTITIVHAGAQILQGFSASTIKKTQDLLVKHAITVRAHTPIKALEPEGLRTASGELIPRPDITLWVAGVTPTVIEQTALHTQTDQSLLPNHALQLSKHVYAGGDVISLKERQRPLPKNAQTAMKMGTHIAKNILREHAGKAPRTFCYRSPGAILWLGSTAAFDLFGYSLTSPWLLRLRKVFYGLRWKQMTSLR